MATKKKTGKPLTRKITTETFEPIDEADEEPPQAAQHWEDDYSADPEVDEILQSVGPGEIKIKILQWSAKGKKYCFTLDGGPVDEDFIQSTFGGGRYQGQIFRNGIYTGKSFELNIAERLNGSGGPSGGMADVQLRFMQQQIDMMRDMLLKGSGRDQTPIGELADAVTKVHQLNGGGGSLGEKAVELLLKGIELGKGISGGDKSDNWADVIKEALPVVGEMMKAKNGGMNGGGLPVQHDGASLPLNSLPAPNQDETIREGIAYLKAKALRNGDPGLYIDWMIDNADSAQYAPILHFVLTSDFSALTALDPEIAKPPYVEFFKSIYDGLRSAFNGADSMGMDTAGAGGNRVDTPPNVSVIKGGSKSSGAKKIS